MKIKLHFDNPILVAQGLEKHQIDMKVLNTSIFQPVSSSASDVKVRIDSEILFDLTTQMKSEAEFNQVQSLAS